MSKTMEALECFKKGKGFNCSQAVFSTYCEQLGMERELGLKVSCGFGGGMGRQGETCGAVSGAYLLIGLKYGKVKEEDNEAKNKTYQLVRQFAKKFEERNKSTKCGDLIGLDFSTADKSIIAEKLKTVCPKMVQDAAEIIEELLELK